MGVGRVGVVTSRPTVATLPTTATMANAHGITDTGSVPG